VLIIEYCCLESKVATRLDQEQRLHSEYRPR
jgi:hypothetical protein